MASSSQGVEDHSSNEPGTITNTLPEGLLPEALAHLGTPSLNTAGTVCKIFCKAYIPVILSLSIGCTPVDSAPPSTLVQRLEVFTSVAQLDLCCGLPQAADILKPSTVASRVAALSLVVSGQDEGNPSSLASIAGTLATLTKLTRLALDAWFLRFPSAGDNLADALKGCCTLKVLVLAELDANQPILGAPEQVAAAVLGVPSLATLLYKGNNHFWPAILQDAVAVRNTRLHALLGVLLNTDDAVRALTCLPCLTLLKGQSREWPAQITMLSALSTLQELELETLGQPLEIQALGSMAVPLKLLQRLTVGYGHFDMDGLDALLACLPALTLLALITEKAAFDGNLRMQQFPATFEGQGFAGLRSLSSPLLPTDPEDVVRLRRELSGLEFLRAVCYDNVCHKLLSDPLPMAILTLLCIRSVKRVGPQRQMHPSGQFLKGVPHLKVLMLENVLDADSWNNDLRYIRALSGLTKLAIVDDMDPNMAGFVPLKIAQVQPLTELSQVRYLKASGRWRAAISSTEFGMSMQEVRHTLGLPPTVIE